MVYGQDNISGRMIRLCVKNIPLPLSMFNNIMNTEIFHTSFFSLRIFSRKRNLPGHGSKDEPQPWQFLDIYNIDEMKTK